MATTVPERSARPMNSSGPTRGSTAPPRSRRQRTSASRPDDPAHGVGGEVVHLQVDDRLVVHDERLGGRLLEVLDDLQAGDLLLQQLGAELDPAVLAGGLGPVHGGVGVAQQGADVVAGAGPGEPDAALHAQDVTAHADLDAQRAEHPAAEPLHVHALGQQDGELVAAEAGHDAAPAQGVAQARADQAQQLVAGLVAEAVVDALEAVEVEVEDDQAPQAAGLAGPLDLLGEALGELQPVGQPGDDVAAGQAVHLLAGADPEERGLPDRGERLQGLLVGGALGGVAAAGGGDVEHDAVTGDDGHPDLALARPDGADHRGGGAGDHPGVLLQGAGEVGAPALGVQGGGGLEQRLAAAGDVAGGAHGAGGQHGHHHRDHQQQRGPARLQAGLHQAAEVAEAADGDAGADGHPRPGVQQLVLDGGAFLHRHRHRGDGHVDDEDRRDRGGDGQQLGHGRVDPDGAFRPGVAAAGRGRPGGAEQVQHEEGDGQEERADARVVDATDPAAALQQTGGHDAQAPGEGGGGRVGEAQQEDEDPDVELDLDARVAGVDLEREPGHQLHQREPEDHAHEQLAPPGRVRAAAEDDGRGHDRHGGREGDETVAEDARQGAALAHSSAHRHLQPVVEPGHILTLRDHMVTHDQGRGGPHSPDRSTRTGPDLRRLSQGSPLATPRSSRAGRSPAYAAPVRTLRPLPVPAGAAVLDLLPLLATALAGGLPHALHPHAAGTAPHPALRTGEPLAAGEDDPDDPTAVVVATSGSTGTPKGALLPAAALRASAAATAARLAPGPGSQQWVLALPAHHVAGLQVLLRSVRAGTEPVVLPAGPFTAAAFVEATARAGGDRLLTSLVPTQLVRLLDAGEEARAALARYDAVLVGSAATPRALLERARAAGARVVTTYGSSETCGGCVYDGVPLDGVVPALEGDRLTLAGPVLARGYRGRPDHPAFAGGRFRTDDTAALQDGRVRVLGRVDDLITTGGLKVAPTPVEEALAGTPGIGEVVVVGVPDEEWGQRVVAVVVPEGTPPTLAEVRERVGAVLPRHAAPRGLLVLAELPLRGPGKPDRAALRALAARS